MQTLAFLRVLLGWSLFSCPRLLLVKRAVLAAARDIVHKHMWNGLTTDTAEQQPSSQQTTLSDAQEAPTGVPQLGSRDLGESCMLSLEPCHVIRAHAVCLERQQVMLQGMMPKLC